MKKIMFNDRYGLTQAVLEGRKTMTRRNVPEKVLKYQLSTPGFAIKDSLYKVGDVVAVAESYKKMYERSLDYALPRYSLLDDYDGTPGWTNKMFVMPEKCSHKIRITDVRLERLQDISDEDCLREGIVNDLGVYAFNDYEGFKTPQLAFKALINRISGKGTWESNSWVYVYTFELVK